MQGKLIRNIRRLTRTTINGSTVRGVQLLDAVKAGTVIAVDDQKESTVNGRPFRKVKVGLESGNLQVIGLDEAAEGLSSFKIGDQIDAFGRYSRRQGAFFVTESYPTPETLTEEPVAA